MQLNGTIVLLIYLVVLVPLMLLGFFFARRKMFNPHHKLVMTTVVIVNWVLIALLMFNSYRGVVEYTPDRTNINFILPTIHLITGSLAQIMGTYLVLLMWTENTPLERLVFFRIKKIKTPMRITLSLWLITVVLGFGIYALFNAPTADAGDAPAPAVTEEALSGEEVADPIATEEAIEEAADTTEEAADPVATEAVDEDPVEEADDPVATEEEAAEAEDPVSTEEPEDEPEAPAATEES